MERISERFEDELKNFENSLTSAMMAEGSLFSIATMSDKQIIAVRDIVKNCREFGQLSVDMVREEEKSFEKIDNIEKKLEKMTDKLDRIEDTLDRLERTLLALTPIKSTKENK